MSRGEGRGRDVERHVVTHMDATPKRRRRGGILIFYNCSSGGGEKDLQMFGSLADASDEEITYPPSSLPLSLPVDGCIHPVLPRVICRSHVHTPKYVHHHHHPTPHSWDKSLLFPPFHASIGRRMLSNKSRRISPEPKNTLKMY